MSNSSSKLTNLAAKMILIMKEVEYIKKTGYNQFHGYKYATESDVTSEMSSAMQKHNVFMFSSIISRDCIQYKTRGGKDSFLITVQIQVTFVDVDSGEEFTGQFYGDGSDSDDKGIYKAITGAQKYALMKTFLVETGDDPERDDIISKKKQNLEKEKIVSNLDEASKRGTERFRKEWILLSKAQQNLVSDLIDKFKVACTDADDLLG